MGQLFQFSTGKSEQRAAPTDETGQKRADWGVRLCLLLPGAAFCAFFASSLFSITDTGLAMLVPGVFVLLVGSIFFVISKPGSQSRFQSKALMAGAVIALGPLIVFFALALSVLMPLFAVCAIPGLIALFTRMYRMLARGHYWNGA